MQEGRYPREEISKWTLGNPCSCLPRRVPLSFLFFRKVSVWSIFKCELHKATTLLSDAAGFLPTIFSIFYLFFRNVTSSLRSFKGPLSKNHDTTKLTNIETNIENVIPQASSPSVALAYSEIDAGFGRNVRPVLEASRTSIPKALPSINEIMSWGAI